MAAADRIRNGMGAEGIERMEASFHGRPFAPHRHDTYAIGMTVSGVQAFNFRGQRWHCLPGECHILHPDETHDGSAGTDEGFGYRMVYVDPALEAGFADQSHMSRQFKRAYGLTPAKWVATLG